MAELVESVKEEEFLTALLVFNASDDYGNHRWSL